MKKNGKLIIAIVVLVALVAFFAGVWFVTRPAVSQGTKNITVNVIHKDGSGKNFTYTTDAEYLGEVLISEGLVEGNEGPYGLYITKVDGEDAIYEKDASYWSLYCGDEYSTLSADQTPIHDGDAFSLVYNGG